MAGRYVSNSEYGAANLVALVLQYREKHGEIDGRLVALAGAIDDKIATLRNDLLGGAGAAFDTFKELQDLFLENKDLIEELKVIAGKHLRFDIAQSLTEAEKSLARSNIGAVSQSEVNSWIDASIPKAPTASVYKSGDTATITIKDASGTTTASISDGLTGPFYTPIVDADGNISWTNNGGLANPATKNIRGPQGVKGDPLTFGDLTAEQIEALRGREGQQGPVGPQGYTFTPSVSSTGVLTWTNNGGLANPSAVNIKGPQGEQGIQGKPFTYDDFTQSQLDALRGPEGQQGQPGSDGKSGVTFIPSLSSSGVLTWTNDGGLSNPNAVSLKGPQGEPGKDGVDGKNGVDGKSFTFSNFTAEQLEALRGPSGSDGKNGVDGLNGKDGATFTPSVSSDGLLSFTNNGGLPNPSPVNIKGPQGSPGKDGSNGRDGSDGATFTPSLDSNGNLSWSNDKGLANPSTVNIRGPQGQSGKDGVNGSDGKDGSNGVDGATFTPSVNANGDLSWTNNQGLTNPVTVNIRGPQGQKGEDGVSPDPSLYLSKEEYAEGFDGGEL